MKNKTVIITGASSGIGKACAEAFAKRGANIVISGRNKENLEQATEEIRKTGAQILAVAGDVSKENDCKLLIEKTIEKFGGIDILINNAGISMRALFKDLQLDVIRKVMDINFWGTVYCTKYALPYLLKTKGSVVGISSIAGYNGLPGRTGYSASKFAMQGFLDALRIENLKTGLHVLVACPGYTASNVRNAALVADGSAQGESPRDEEKMMSAEEVAEEIVKAVEKRKRTIVLTGQGKLAVWMNKFFPALTDKLVFNAVAKEGDIPLK
ncbi:MAG: putative oxidoreductase [Bacteroidia bacterium]|nr:putative oxidoreductase [Bacteroidia bacterium]